MSPPPFLIFVPLTKETIMATLTFTLSTVPNKDTHKVEILARYRNTRKVAQRAHTRIFILPEYCENEEIVITKRKNTKEVQEHKTAEAKFRALKTEITEKGNNTLPDDMPPPTGCRTPSTASSSPRTTPSPTKAKSASRTRPANSSGTRKSPPSASTPTTPSSASSNASSCTPAKKSSLTRPTPTPCWPWKTSSAMSTSSLSPLN